MCARTRSATPAVPSNNVASPEHCARCVAGFCCVSGPRILVSDVSTAQSGLLRWKLVLRGNNAAEFGVIPAELEVRAQPHFCALVQIRAASAAPMPR